MRKHIVIFEPSGRRGRVDSGATLLEAARQLGENIESICGGKTACGKCLVKIQDKLLRRKGQSQQFYTLTPPSDKELKFLAARGLDTTYRLACEARIKDDTVVFVPETSRSDRQVIRKASIARPVRVKPAMQKYFVELTPPSLDDMRSDAARLVDALNDHYRLKHLSISIEALSGLSDTLRKADWKATALVWMNRQVINVVGGYIDGLYGVAVDIGTTSVAAYLCNLVTGSVISEEAVLNPQIKYGEDVITRINFEIGHHDGLLKLHEAITAGIRKLLSSVVKKAGIRTLDIAEVTVVGNTAMHHIFLRMDPRWLAQSPFTPTVVSSMNTQHLNEKLGLSKHCNVHTLPVIAGFVGADTSGALISEEPHRQDKIILLIDIGTNGEIVLGNRHRLLAASCAMGPAFEGGSISHGMRAAKGAIEKVEIINKSLEVRFKVIGSDRWNNDSPQIKASGICGSGIIDASAAMYRAGIIEPNGRFNKSISSSSIINTGDGLAFIIARADETSIGQDITVSIDDIRAVQLGKAAMCAGVKILMDKLGIARVDKVILAGAFGSYINKENAMAIGLFPPCELKNVYSVGNAAGEGARLALINTNKRKEAERITKRIEYIELTAEPNFQPYFVDALSFPTVE